MTRPWIAKLFAGRTARPAPTPRPRTRLPRFLTLAALALSLLAAPAARAADFTWSSARNITADADVLATGTLVAAYNVGRAARPGVPGVPSTAVNGVTFAPFAVTYHTTSASAGNFTLTFSTEAFGVDFSGVNPLTPITGLSSSYRTLLSSGAVDEARGSAGTITITMSALTPNQSYTFQFWAMDSPRILTLNPNLVQATAGNSVTLSSNTSSMNGGLGQYAVGTFVADATTQDILLSGVDMAGSFPLINAFQLRTVAPVPEPATVGLAASAGLAGLGALQRLRRRATTQPEVASAS